MPAPNFMSRVVWPYRKVSAASAASTLNDGIVAFWKLDEASGTRADSVGSNDLTDNNTVTQAVGKIGNAAQFTSANSEFLSIVSNSDLQTGDVAFWFSTWMYLDDLSNRTAFAKWNISGDDREYALFYSVNDLAGTNRFVFGVSPDGSASTFVAADNLGAASIDTWYHLVGWHDPDNDEIGLVVNNGTADTAAHTTGVNVGVSTFFLGKLVGSFYRHDGRLDATGFWKGSVPTAAQISELWNDGAGLEHPF